MKRHLQRLTTEQLKTKETTKAHERFMKTRQGRLDKLAKEFALCRTSLAMQQPTPEHLLALWKKAELFKEELLEIGELLNEYFRRTEKRLQRTNDTLVKIEELSRPASPTPQPRNTHEWMHTNPFHVPSN